LAAVKPRDVAIEAASSPAREILSKLRLMERCAVVRLVQSSCHITCRFLITHPRQLPSAACLHHRRVHVPAIRLPCCACAIAHICILGLCANCRMDIPTVCQPSRILTAPQMNHCSTMSLENLPSTVTKQGHFQSILETILSDEDVCRHDAVVLVDHPGVRAFPNPHVLCLNLEVA
jgi:hypothetical protein